MTLPTTRTARCVVMRGGTSRGVFFDAAELPTEAAHRDAILLSVIGGSDPRQVDGLGGADLLLSKVALVWPSTRADADVECRFGSITPGSPVVKFGANCGNLSSAAACFARDEGLVAPGAGCVRLFNPDSGTSMEARWRGWETQLRSRLAATSGMPVSGDLLELSFLSPVGTATGRLLPTGRAADCLRLPDGRPVRASLVDAGAFYVFLDPRDIGLLPDATTDQLRVDPDLAALCEDLRGQAAVLAGLVPRPADAISVTPAVPKLSFVSAPRAYRTEGRHVPVSPDEVDLVGRIVSSQSFHKAYAVTGAIATAAAAAVAGSVVSSTAGYDTPAGRHVVRIGHPTGIIECTLDVAHGDGGVAIERATVLRSARRIMEGRCYFEEPAA